MRLQSAVLGIGISLGAGACKADDAKPAAPPPAEPRPATHDRPTDPKRWRGLSRELPVIEGAKQLVAPRTTPNNEDIFTSWCIDTRDPEAAARRVAETLEADGWNDVATRGTGAKLGVSGRSGDRRISIVVGGTDAACTGIVASATVVRTGAFTPPPPLEDGEKIR